MLRYEWLLLASLYVPLPLSLLVAPDACVDAEADEHDNGANWNNDNHLGNTLPNEH